MCALALRLVVIVGAACGDSAEDRLWYVGRAYVREGCMLNLKGVDCFVAGVECFVPGEDLMVGACFVPAPFSRESVYMWTLRVAREGYETVSLL